MPAAVLAQQLLRLRGVFVAMSAGLLMSGCAVDSSKPQENTSASPPSADASSGSPSEEATLPDTTGEADLTISRIPADQWQRMLDNGVWRPGCPLGRSSLRRVVVNHHTFDGAVDRGVLVVNRDVALTVALIFSDLFAAGFPIRKMVPVEEYGGDVNASLADDNTSAYNCRRPDQINAPTLLSPHANGRAIDINPRENPWKDLRCDCWVPTADTKARTPGPGVITRGGLVWRLFTEAGWIWQNIDVPDYMHFDTGYPSRRYRPVSG